MGEKNLWSKVGLIVLLVGMSLWQVWPPQQQLKPGIDLGGGYSLLFEIDDTDDKSPDLAERVMTVLKNRVDPQGTRNLVWRPVGRNRLEIQMPLPREEQRANRAEYERIRAAVTATHITETQIRSALALPSDQQDAVFEPMVGSYKARRSLFSQLMAADRRYKELSAEFAKTGSTQPASSQPAAASTLPAVEWDDSSKPLPERVDAAYRTRNEIVGQLLQTNLDARVLEDLLELGRKNQARRDGIANLRTQHPDLVPLIDQMVKVYDQYSAVKGALDDPSDLMRLLRGAGVLEFRILATKDPRNPDLLEAKNPEYNVELSTYVNNLAKYGPRRQPGDKYQWFKISKPDMKDWPEQLYIIREYAAAKYVLAHATEDMGLLRGKGWSLRGAFPGRDSFGRLSIDFRLGGLGPKLFGELTSNNIDRPLCIILDDEAVSAANIKSTIYDSGQITGRFTPQYVDYIVRTLEAGTLPARLKEQPIQEKSVGPSLGATNRQSGMRAVVAAFAVTVAFMAIYYSYNGLIADIALLLNLVITLGVMSFLQATFTLPGIAGLVLTLGMAVDANVLIYERMREELQRGVSARMASKLGYEKAFSAILDSNVTTIITAVILAVLGSEEVKGFGLTLGIGLCISMFTALFVTRQFFYVMVPNTLNPQETRKAWLEAGILVAAAALFMGLGYLWNSPEARADSSLLGFGRFLAWLAGTAAALMISLWAFRLFYRAIGHQKANRLPMLKLMSAPNIDWMGKYRIFWTASAVIIGLGILLMAGIDTKQYLDIEFIGGTSVQVELKQDKQNLKDTDVLARVTDNKGDNNPSTSAGWLKQAASLVDGAVVKAEGEDRFTVSIPEAKLTASQLVAVLTPALEDYVVRGGIVALDDNSGVTVQIKPPAENQAALLDLAGVQVKVKDAANYARSAADKLSGARVQEVRETTTAGERRNAFEVIVSETRKTLVAESLLATMSDILEVIPSISARAVPRPAEPDDPIFPIKTSATTLGEVIGEESTQALADRNYDFRGGLALVYDDLNPPQSSAQITDRIKQMRLQPGFEEHGARETMVVGLEAADGAGRISDNTPCKRIAVLVRDPALLYADGEDNARWRADVAERERDLVKAALASSRSLQRVTQFAAQVAGEMQTKALIAILLSLIAIAAYLWVRFGTVTFGVAGIIALYHDVAIALAGIFVAHYVYDTPVGEALMLRDFKIDLNIVAALLTIVGFSINDTIVIFDRIRENRGRMATISAKLINDSLNQTLSRTVLTTLTVMMTLLVMYIWGGEGIHGFAFTMIVGCLSGTYSTLAIATPLTHHPRILWVVTIIIGALTVIGLLFLIDTAWLQYALIVIVVVLAAAGLFGQYAASVRERSTRQISPA